MEKDMKQKKHEKVEMPAETPDTGQGAAGDFGSDADVGRDRVSGNDDKSAKDTQDGSPVPVKRQD